jgi:hypothetical protein
MLFIIVAVFLICSLPRTILNLVTGVSRVTRLGDFRLHVGRFLLLWAVFKKIAQVLVLHTFHGIYT